ncbi:MAG: hypothetical protein IH945_02075 [Armatimonadetes bacterium]|nr:hypothetical protein [Armatimonadota bacterium]
MRILVGESETEGMWYARVLDHDLLGDGFSMDGALTELARVLNVHVAACADLGKSPYTCIEPAPDEVQALWETATPIDAKLPDLRPTTVPVPEIRQLAA